MDDRWDWKGLTNNLKCFTQILISFALFLCRKEPFFLIFFSGVEFFFLDEHAEKNSKFHLAWSADISVLKNVKIKEIPKNIV